MESIERRKLDEVAVFCGIPCESIHYFIQEAWIRPIDETPLFDEEDIARIRLIWELKEDFGVNEEAIPIILNLIDQVNRMHLEIERYKGEMN